MHPLRVLSYMVAPSRLSSSLSLEHARAVLARWQSAKAESEGVFRHHGRSRGEQGVNMKPIA